MKVCYAVTRGCTRCLMCYYEYPVGAIEIIADVSAKIDSEKCTDRGRCINNCVSEAIIKIIEDKNK